MFAHERIVEFAALLEESEHWPADRLQAWQDEQLSQLLRHAFEQVPFYRERLAPLFRRRWGPRLHKWSEIPILTRADIAAAGDALRADAIPADHGEITTRRSSGTTGDPVVVDITDLRTAMWGAVGQREIRWAGVDPDRRYGVIRHLPALAEGDPPDGMAYGVGAPFATIFGQAGDCIGLRWDAPPAAKADWLGRVGIRNLNARPSDYREIVHAIATGESPAHALDAALLLGEPIGPGLRARIADTLGQAPVDRYSAVELGYIALECPEGSGYRVPAETILVEIVDDDGRPLPHGKFGRVVATPLFNYASPLIRYDCGDIAMAGAPLDNSQFALPVIAQIAGRPVNRFRDPDGGHFWPSLAGIDPDEILPCYAWQLAQTGAEAFEFRYVTDAPLKTTTRDEVDAALLRMLPGAPEIIFRRLRSAPVARASRKLNVFVNEVDWPQGSEIVDI